MSEGWLERLARRAAGVTASAEPRTLAQTEATHGDPLSRRTFLGRTLALAAAAAVGSDSALASRLGGARSTRCAYANSRVCVSSWAKGNYDRWIEECHRNWSRIKPDPNYSGRQTAADLLARELGCYDAAYREWARVTKICVEECPPPMRRPRKPSKPPTNPPPPSTTPPSPPAGPQPCASPTGLCCDCGWGSLTPIGYIPDPPCDVCKRHCIGTC